MTMKSILMCIFCFVMIQSLKAEPWLSNRYAQNCAGCHAPGRVNRVPKDRRCTLSCQGCHTNPNGGGMRNQYGNWTSERWLRSHYAKGSKINKPTPAPYQKQVYGPLLEAYKLSDKKHTKISKKMSKKKSMSIMKKDAKKILDPEKGYPLVGIDKNKVNEKYYDKYHDTRWKVDNKNPVVDMASVTKKDPLRLVKTDWFRPSLDARFFYINAKYENSTKEDFSGISLMNLDLGVELKPFKPNYKFVFETRYGNSPQSSQWDSIFNSTTGSTTLTKSAYLLVDDLMYNTYFMYGLFRPMFGIYDPNHYGLAQRVNGLAYNGTVKGVSVGAAPNVPFLNVHFITPRAGESTQESGMALNAGARFVTLSASAVFSYWKTKVEGSTDYDREMWSMHLGGMFKKFIINAELMRYDKTTDSDKNGGTVTTFDLRYPVWREHYLQFNYASSNVASDLTEGSANEMILGYKVFLYSGMELEFNYKTQEETKSDTTSKATYLQSQLHLYF